MAAEGAVALCVARFYGDLADLLAAGARETLHEASITEIETFDVSGAFELPLAAKYAAESGRFAGVVCLGAVIRGETDHYTHVALETARGIQQVQLETGIPCGFGVLTVDDMDQAMARVRGGDKRDTGATAAEAVLAALEVKRRLSNRRGRTGFNV